MVFCRLVSGTGIYCGNISTVKLLYTVKEREGNMIENHTPHPYCLRNPYRNLKSEYSQDLGAETSTKVYVHEFGFRTVTHQQTMYYPGGASTTPLNISSYKK